jgi:hypothetical protein
MTGIPAALAAALLFGVATPLAKLLLGPLDPWLLAGVLYLGSGIGLALVRFIRSSVDLLPPCARDQHCNSIDRRLRLLRRTRCVCSIEPSEPSCWPPRDYVRGRCRISRGAQSNAAKSKPSTLPEPLTQEAVRELVARQSDEQVRQLLIAQLDRAAAAPAKAKGDEEMSKMVETNAGIVRERLGDLRDAFVALPATLRQVVANLDDPEGTSALPRAGVVLLGVLVIAWLVERLYHLALRNYRKTLAPPVGRPSRRVPFAWPSVSPSASLGSPCLRLPLSRCSWRCGRDMPCGGSQSWRC